MKIETKYNIGDVVTQNVYEDLTEVLKITEIIVDVDGLSYKLNYLPMLYQESELTLDA